MKKILSKCILAVFIFTMLVFCPNPVKAATPVEKNVNESFTDSLTERTSENWYRIVCGKNSYITLFLIPIIRQYLAAGIFQFMMNHIHKFVNIGLLRKILLVTALCLATMQLFT